MKLNKIIILERKKKEIYKVSIKSIKSTIKSVHINILPIRLCFRVITSFLSNELHLHIFTRCVQSDLFASQHKISRDVSLSSYSLLFFFLVLEFSGNLVYGQEGKINLTTVVFQWNYSNIKFAIIREVK